MKTLTCDMARECAAVVTHIGEKGYLYCKDHAIQRRKYVGERCRLMRLWELKLAQAGEPLPSYQRIPKPKPVAA